MGNLFIPLPAPAANGVGAAVDVSTMGAHKTIQFNGVYALPNRPPTINIEMNNDAGHAGSWAPVATFQGGQKAQVAVVNVAARWMRARVQNYRGGPAPEINVGATDDGASFDALPTTTGDGTGAAVDISALPIFKTLQVGDGFTGSLVLEISEDAGGVDWVSVMAMQAPGQISFTGSASWARIKRSGSKPPVGSPIATLGACSPPGGGGGGGDVIFDKVTLQELRFSPAISPPALPAGATDDWGPAGYSTTSRVRVTTDAAGSTLTGFDATGVSDGDLHLIENLGPGILTLANQNAGSVVGNRTITPGGTDIVIPAGGAAIMIYDGTQTRNRIDGLALGDSAAATLRLLNGNAGAIVSGTPVYSSADGAFDKAKADAIGTSLVLGLAAADIGIGASGPIATAGPVTFTTVQWDAVVTGGAGGLVFNTKYYLDPVNAGKLTTTAPVADGQVVEPVGKATSTVTMLVGPSIDPVLL